MEYVLKVYLSGEIHTDWREQIIEGCKAKSLDISFTSANTHHESSDAAGDGLGVESQQFWRDHKSAKVNAIRIQTAIKACDVAIIRFGDKYKQWNAAFDAGYCAALGKPYITRRQLGARSERGRWCGASMGDDTETSSRLAGLSCFLGYLGRA
jgi:YtoQ family protein